MFGKLVFLFHSFVTFWLLPVTSFLFFFTFWSLVVTFSSLLANFCLLFVRFCLLHVIFCLLFATFCPLILTFRSLLAHKFFTFLPLKITKNFSQLHSMCDKPICVTNWNKIWEIGSMYYWICNRDGNFVNSFLFVAAFDSAKETYLFFKGDLCI